MKTEKLHIFQTEEGNIYAYTQSKDEAFEHLMFCANSGYTVTSKISGLANIYTIEEDQEMRVSIGEINKKAEFYGLDHKTAFLLANRYASRVTYEGFIFTNRSYSTFIKVIMNSAYGKGENGGN